MISASAIPTVLFILFYLYYRFELGIALQEFVLDIVLGSQITSIFNIYGEKCLLLFLMAANYFFFNFEAVDSSNC